MYKNLIPILYIGDRGWYRYHKYDHVMSTRVGLGLIIIEHDIKLDILLGHISQHSGKWSDMKVRKLKYI